MASAFGRILAIALFFASAIWLGSLIGGLACHMGYSRHHGLPDPRSIFMTPLLLINLWIVPNVAFLAIMMIHVFVGDGIGHIAWGVIVAFESLFVMLGWGLRLEEMQDILIAWSCWLVLLVMVETGVWLHRQMLMNRWAREMAELRNENAMRRVEREASQAMENPGMPPDTD